MLYQYGPRAVPTDVPEPEVMQVAKQLLDDAYEAATRAQHDYAAAARAHQDAWDEFHRVRRRTNRQNTVNKSKQRRAHERSVSARAGAKRQGGAYKNRAQMYRADRRANEYSETAEALSRERRLLQEELDVLRAACRVAEVSMTDAATVQAAAEQELDRARVAIRYFFVTPGALLQLHGEPDEHFEQRLAYLLERRRWLIEWGEIPVEYRDSVDVKEKDDGTVHFFFGSSNTPGIKDHAHYIRHIDGVWELQRPPGVKRPIRPRHTT